MTGLEHAELGRRYETVATLERFEHEERVVVKNRATGGFFLARVWLAQTEGSGRLDRVRDAARLRGGHTVRVVDVASDESKPFVVSERVDGDSLSAYWAGRRLPPIEASVLATHVLDSLAEAHRVGLVHGNLEPGNVMVVDDATGPWAKVAGYDEVVRPVLRPEGAEWVAPERIKERPATPAGDLYSAGLILYRALFGRSFGVEGEDLLAAAYRRMKPAARTDDPLWNAELEAFFDKALAPQPEDRFPTADLMLRALRRIPFDDELPIAWSHRLVSEIGVAPRPAALSERPRRRPSVWVFESDSRVSDGAVRLALEDARSWLDVRLVRDDDIPQLVADIEAGDLEVPWVLVFGEFRAATSPLRERIDRERETSRVLVVPPDGPPEWLPHLRAEGLDAIVASDVSEEVGRTVLQRALERTQTLLHGYEQLRSTYARTREHAHLLSRVLARTTG